MAQAREQLPKASVLDTLRVMGGVVTPTVAKGAILRRPRMVAMAEWMELDDRAVRRMQRLQDRYGAGPVLLDPDHVWQVLDGTPEPYATASTEKRGALAHFEPKGALIFHGAARADRRAFNERVLESDHPMHRLSGRFVGVVEEEAAVLAAEVRRRGGGLAWEPCIDAWFRVVRRVIFGIGARDDEQLPRMINRLRASANWGFLAPRRRKLRARFLARVEEHLERAEPGSLAAVIAAALESRRTAPEQQIPQWLFAFDPAGMTTFRTLALLASHPEHLERAREEMGAGDGSGQWAERLGSIARTTHRDTRLEPQRIR
jgi:hypothetical protein